MCGLTKVSTLNRAIAIKHAAAWEGHLGSKGHRTKVMQAKEEEAAREREAESERKRKAEEMEVEEREQDDEEEGSDGEELGEHGECR